MSAMRNRMTSSIKTKPVVKTTQVQLPTCDGKVGGIDLDVMAAARQRSGVVLPADKRIAVCGLVEPIPVLQRTEPVLALRFAFRTEKLDEIKEERASVRRDLRRPSNEPERGARWVSLDRTHRDGS